MAAKDGRAPYGGQGEACLAVNTPAIVAALLQLQGAALLQFQGDSMRIHLFAG